MFSLTIASRETDQFATSLTTPHVPGDAISIIVPTLNEAENIGRVLEDIVDSVSHRYVFEILVADGGSTDGTCEQVSRWTAIYPVSLIRNKRAGGLANDVMAAALKAKYPVLVVIDADGSHPASSIADLVDPVLTGGYDMVLGSRYVEGGTTTGWPFRRRALSRFGAALASPFTNAADPMSGFFAIRRTDLLASGLRAEGFKIGLEAIFAGGDTLRVLEVPISFADRTLGRSKLGVSHFVAYFSQLARFCGVSPSRALKRFTVVGMAGVVLDFMVVWIALTIGVDPTVAYIFGFCCASAFNYVAHSEWTFEGRSKTGSQTIRYLLLQVLALAMRGGFIAAAADLDLPVVLVIFAGIIGGGVVSYLGSEFFVFRDNSSFPSTSRWKLAAIAVLGYVVLLRVVYQASIDLLPQEAYYWSYAQHPAFGYLDHPPMVAWLIGFGTSILGDTEFGVRIAATLSWLTMAYFVFRLTFNLYGRTAAFIALLLLSTLPFYFAIGFLMTPDAPLAAAWAGTLYFLERALIANRSKAWIGVGMCIGIGMLSKYTIGLLGMGTVTFLLLHPGSRRWLFCPWPYVGALIAALFFSPVIVWNAVNGWASFEFQGTRRWVSDELQFSLHVLVWYIAVLVGPLGLALGAAASRVARMQERLDRVVFVNVFTLVPLCVFVVFSLFHMVKLNWAGPVWLALLPTLANVFATVVGDNRLRWLNSLLKASVVASAISFSLLLHYLALGLPGIGYTGSLRGLPIAWEEFGREAEKIGDDVAARSGVKPLLVGMDRYNIASILGFYATGRGALDRVTSQNIFGENGLMFGVWHSKPSREREVVVMYSLKRDRLSDAEIAPWFDRIDPLEMRFVHKDTAEVGQFFYRIGYGLRPGGADQEEQRSPIR